jgi:hypothetical protein
MSGRKSATSKSLIVLAGTDIFEIILSQPASQAELDPTYQRVLSTMWFMR